MATLGLGIAVATLVFAWVDTVLLRPIPGVARVHELAALEAINPGGLPIQSVTHPDFRDFQRHLPSSGVIATHLGFFTIGEAPNTRRVLGQIVSANFFDVLGVQPALGRLLQTSEDRDEPGRFPIAVISHRLWRSHFNGDPAAVGRPVRVNGRILTIVGVAPPEFQGTLGGAALDLWAPLSLATNLRTLNTWAANDRNARFLDVIVRLRPGDSLPQAGERARAIAARIAESFPDTHHRTSARLVPFTQAMYGLHRTLGSPIRVLMAASLLLLFIGCANVSNLLLARAVARRREFGIRVALGATRGQILRQLTAEALLLAAGGSLSGILLASWLSELTPSLLPLFDQTISTALAPLTSIQLHGRVLAFTIGGSLVTALLATLLPALGVSRWTVAQAINDTGRTASPSRRAQRARASLVVAETALATLALVLALTALLAFRRALAADPLFQPNGLLVAQLNLGEQGYTLARERQFNQDLALRLAAQPGIAAAAYADSIPLSLIRPSAERVQSVSAETSQEGVPLILRMIVSPGFFRLMGIPLLEGRDFAVTDTAKSPRVIIVNQAFARRRFGSANPIGRQLRVSGNVVTVIGVVAGSKYETLGEPATELFYGAFQQIYYSGHYNFIYVRASGPLEAARASFRRTLNELDPRLAHAQLISMPEHIQGGLLAERLAAAMLSAFAALSLLLASIGLYVVLAYIVTERTQELGIRLTLGATPWRVMGMVMSHGLLLALSGAALGLLAASALLPFLGRFIQLPPGLTSFPALALAAVPFLLVTLLATALPSFRATRVNPITALRAQ